MVCKTPKASRQYPCFSMQLAVRSTSDPTTQARLQRSPQIPIYIKWKQKFYIYFIYIKVIQNNSYPLNRKAFNVVPSVLFLKAVLPTTHSIDFETCNLYIFFLSTAQLGLPCTWMMLLLVFRFLILQIQGLRIFFPSDPTRSFLDIGNKCLRKALN